MKKEVPKWRKRFVSEPEYFRQVYKYVYDLGRQDGAKVIGASSQITETISLATKDLSSLISRRFLLSRPSDW